MTSAGRIPNFFIVGAPKAGTTSLYHYLDQHPAVFMSPLKEPNYFSSELRPENFCDELRPRIESDMRALGQYLLSDLREKRFVGLVCSWEDYLRLFQNARAEPAVGEATPCYLWSATAAQNIAARIPHARIIINLRDPADRAFSQYLNMVSERTTRRSFTEQVRANLACVDKRFGPDWPLLEFGLYYEQIRRYLDVFPREQIHISLYEDLERTPQRLIADLCAFLGVEGESAELDLSHRHHVPQLPRLPRVNHVLKRSGLWPYLRSLAPRPLGPRLRSLLVRPRSDIRMDPADRDFLVGYYREDIRRLETLLDRDLSAWLSAHTALRSSSAGVRP
jgi:hypothetical protein